MSSPRTSDSSWWIAVIAALGGLALGAPEARAGEVERAAHAEDAAHLLDAVAQGRWEDAEAAYLRLLALEAHGEPLSADDHLFGAEAARARGDMARCRERVARGAAAGDTTAQQWLPEIDASYGRVEVLGPGALAWTDPQPLSEEGTSAARFAQQALEAGAFAGLLPVGAWSLDGAPFSVQAGTTVSVDPRPSQRIGAATGSRPSAITVGPHLSLGVAGAWLGAEIGDIQARETGFGGLGEVGIEARKGQLVGSVGAGAGWLGSQRLAVLDVQLGIDLGRLEVSGGADLGWASVTVRAAGLDDPLDGVDLRWSSAGLASGGHLAFAYRLFDGPGRSAVALEAKGGGAWLAGARTGWAGLGVVLLGTGGLRDRSRADGAAERDSPNLSVE